MAYLISTCSLNGANKMIIISENDIASVFDLRTEFEARSLSDVNRVEEC